MLNENIYNQNKKCLSDSNRQIVSHLIMQIIFEMPNLENRVTEIDKMSLNAYNVDVRLNNILLQLMQLLQVHF
jgi:hypothetical protein